MSTSDLMKQIEDTIRDVKSVPEPSTISLVDPSIVERMPDEAGQVLEIAKAMFAADVLFNGDPPWDDLQSTRYCFMARAAIARMGELYEEASNQGRSD